jgi:hypothetical protein
MNNTYDIQSKIMQDPNNNILDSLRVSWTEVSILRKKARNLHNISASPGCLSLQTFKQYAKQFGPNFQAILSIIPNMPIFFQAPNFLAICQFSHNFKR